MHTRNWVVTLLATVLMLATVGHAQMTLTLSQAVSVALEKNPLRKAALAEQSAAGAGVREARSALLPRLTFTETATRGNDPVFAFGTRLRQRRFTAADFELHRLNQPTPIGNFATRFGGNWNLFNFSSWLNISRAGHMKDAAARQLERTDQETIFRVIQAYYGVLIAMKEEQLTSQTQQTAQAILENARSRYESGMVVESDYLAAQVNAATRQQELIEARNQVSLAQAALANAMGVPPGPVYAPGEALDERSLPQDNIEDLEKRALENRPDLKRIVDEQQAQDAGVRMARAAFAPRLNAYASWEMDNPTLFAGGGGNNWVGGLELQFDLFTGGEKVARLQQEQAKQERIAAMHQYATDGVRLEVRRAYYDVDATRQKLEVARAAIRQAEESLRINQDRYNAGLTTMTDMLRAEDAARMARTNYWQMVYRYYTSYAGLELATGTLNSQSPVVTP